MEKNYDVVGEITLKSISVIEGKPITLKNVLVFYDRKNPPDLVPLKSAFNVILTDISGKKTVGSFIALVTEVIEYTIDDYGLPDSLIFNYKRIENTSAELTTIEPVISHIFVREGFIALIYEGDETAVKTFLRNDRISFIHGGTVYYQVSIHSIDVKTPDDVAIGGDAETHLATMLIASDKRVPSKAAIRDFTNRMNYLVEKYYRLGDIEGAR